MEQEEYIAEESEGPIGEGREGQNERERNMRFMSSCLLRAL